MSENDTPLDKDPESFDGMASALAFAEHVVGDFKRLEPAAWVFWQAAEDLSTRDGGRRSNWGLVKADLRGPDAGPHPIHVTRKYWAMAQFSRYLRPGYRLVTVDDMDTAGALSPTRARSRSSMSTPPRSRGGWCCRRAGAWRRSSPMPPQCRLHGRHRRAAQVGRHARPDPPARQG